MVQIVGNVWGSYRILDLTNCPPNWLVIVSEKTLMIYDISKADKLLG